MGTSFGLYVRMVLRWWWVIVVTILLGVVGSIWTAQAFGWPWWAWIIVGLLGIVGAQFLAFHEYRTKAQEINAWSAYDFFRDRVNDSIEIKRRNEHTWGDRLDLAIDFGRLVGGTVATLRGRGLNREADSLFPFGKPLHVSDRAAYDRVNDLPANIRMRAEELEGRLKILRDRYATPTS
jgi:hypothetical protein